MTTQERINPRTDTATHPDKLQRASVVVIKGHGEARLRQAMMQGLLRDEIIADVQEALETIERMRTELVATQHALDDEQKKTEGYHAVFVDALAAKRREETRAKKFETAKITAFILLAMFTIVFTSMVICRTIFG